MRLILPHFLRFRKNALSSSAAFGAILLASLISHPAFAATTLGDVFCTVANNVSPFGDVFNMIAYVAGAFFVVQGVTHLKGHYENPNQHPMRSAVSHLAAGSLLLLLPTVLGTLVDTIFTYGGGSGDDSGGGMLVTACAAGGGNAVSGSVVPLDTILTNFVNNIQIPLTFLVTTVAEIMGIFLVVRGLMKASKYGTDPRSNSTTNIVANLLIGTVLVVLGQNMDAIRGSVTGDTGQLLQFEGLGWTSINSLGGDTTNFKLAIKAALTFFQLVGLISFVRGWNVIRHAVEGQGQATIAQGLTHIIGGALAINIYLFMEIMDKTFGTQFVT